MWWEESEWEGRRDGAGWAGRSSASGTRCGQRPGDRVAFKPLQVSAHLRGTLITKLAVSFDGLADDFFQLREHLGIHRRCGNGRPIENSLHDNAGSSAGECQLASGHFV